MKLYEGIDKLRNKKITLIKKSKYIAAAGVLAFLSLTTGCGTKIDTKYSISEVIEKIKDTSLIDENLEVIKVVPTEGEESLTFAEAEEAYKIARAEKNRQDCNKYIYTMAQTLLCSEIASTYNINLNEVSNINFKVTNKDEKSDYFATLTYKTKEEKMVPGGITTIEDVDNEVSVKLVGDAKEMASIITKAHSDELQIAEGSADHVDDCFETLRNSAIGQSEVSFTFFKKPHFNIIAPTSKKIKKLELDK
ncbi:MAG: hypothetical protein VZS44_02320 [Bacilli bacterium]|nr:hypothetical protein [Bacilli bacterium]